MFRSPYSVPKEMKGAAAAVALLAAFSNWTCGASSPLGAEEGRFATVQVTPSAVEVAPGETVQFAAMLTRMSGKQQHPNDWSWSATGGEIDAAGTYVAGSVVGTYYVRASRRDMHGYENSGQAVVTVKGTASTPEQPRPPTAPTDGVRVPPGTDIQAFVDRNPPGTTFVLQAGRHLKQSILPKDGMTFVGEPGAVMDGGGTVESAFDGRKTPSNVTIRGLVMENYAPPIQTGVVNGGRPGAWFTEGWVVEDNEIRYNAASTQHKGCSSSRGCGGMGIKLGNRMIVRNNYLHHNDEYGVGGKGKDVLVEGNEIAYNNHRDAVTIGFGAGGTKFVGTDGLVVRDNFVHHNHGNGIWMDVENQNTLIEKNRVEDNRRQGIFQEISHAAVIRNNEVRRNGFEEGGWLYGAGILIAHSDNVEVYGNVVEGNYNGIVGIQQDRENHQLKNLWVHDNRVSMSAGASGVGKSGSNNYNPFAANNRFDRNSYTVDQDLGKPFRWDGSATWSEWRAVGQDLSGAFNTN